MKSEKATFIDVLKALPRRMMKEIIFWSLIFGVYCWAIWCVRYNDFKKWVLDEK